MVAARSQEKGCSQEQGWGLQRWGSPDDRRKRRESHHLIPNGSRRSAKDEDMRSGQGKCPRCKDFGEKARGVKWVAVLPGHLVPKLNRESQAGSLRLSLTTESVLEDRAAAQGVFRVNTSTFPCSFHQAQLLDIIYETNTKDSKRPLAGWLGISGP